MDEQRFGAEIHRWLRESGRMQELQTKLRKDLADALTHRLPRKKPDDAAADPKSKAKVAALNTLLMEHLLRGRCWLTASVFASEADFSDGDAIFDPELAAAGRTSTPAPKLRDDVVDRLLERLELRELVSSEELRVRYYRRQDESLLSSLLQTADLARSGPNVHDQLAEMEEWLRLRRDKTQPSKEKTMRRLARLKSHLAKKEKELSKEPSSSRSEQQSAVSELSSGQPEKRQDVQDPQRQLEPASSGASGSEQSGDRPEESESRHDRQSDLVQELQRQLSQTRRELEEVRSSQQKLLQVVKAQEEDLVCLREVPTSRGEESVAGRPQMDDFVTEIRNKISTLYQNSVSIDKEFSDL